MTAHVYDAGNRDAAPDRVKKILLCGCPILAPADSPLLEYLALEKELPAGLAVCCGACENLHRARAASQTNLSHLHDPLLPCQQLALAVTGRAPHISVALCTEFFAQSREEIYMHIRVGFIYESYP